MEQALVIYNEFATYALIILGLVAFFILVRAIIGPTAADRLVAANMLGTVTMAMIVVLLLKLKEGFLADICVIYALISFLAVVVFCKVFAGAYIAKKKKEEDKNNGHN